jgi:hypothetical protein
VLDVQQVAEGRPHREEVNLVPQNDVMTAGMPNLLPHPLTRHLLSLHVVVAVVGIASGHRDVLSTIMNRWVNPWKAGRRPGLPWMWLNRREVIYIEHRAGKAARLDSWRKMTQPGEFCW